MVMRRARRESIAGYSLREPSEVRTGDVVSLSGPKLSGQKAASSIPETLAAFFIVPG